jgi:hypothetical protein
MLIYAHLYIQKTLQTISTYKVNSPVFDIVPTATNGHDLTIVTGFGKTRTTATPCVP